MQDEHFMQRAIELAEKGRYSVRPNPLVGCVLVRDGEIIAEGWHDHLGGLHAEQMAIADAESRGVETQGSVAYVTLEPCNHFGRTPPCSEALMWAGVKKVVIGIADPNPTVRGGGLEALSREGIEIEIGVLEKECHQQMSAFMYWCEHKRPQVLLKAATDSNGRIDGDPEKPATRFSSKESLELVHKIRRDSMAIIVGVNTVIRDNPKLTVREGEKKPHDIVPKRVVIDPNNRIPVDSHLMSVSDAETYLINAKMYDSGNDKSHVNRIVLPSEDGEIDVEKILDCLGDLEVQTLLVEGGLKTWNRFLKLKLVDSAHLCVSRMELDAKNRDYFHKNCLEDAGLILKEEITLGNDTITKWERI
tara:strand:+ start:1185 stop:2267 length:1083 start_codon:yes stop_codon:yes gene_type:complete